MLSANITPYEGSEPFIFVSYAHDDSALVLPILEKLDAAGYRVWYDEGIAPGSEWPENIAEHMNGSRVVLAFLSNAAMESPNCRREVNYALAKRKDFLGVMLEQTAMSPGMEMQLSSQQCILRYNYKTEEAFLKKVLGSSILDPCREGTAAAPVPERIPQAAEKTSRLKPWMIIAAAVLCLAVAGALLLPGLLRSGKQNDPVQTAETESRGTEQNETTTAQPATTTAAPTTAAPTTPAPTTTARTVSVEVGDRVVFGVYEQDNDTANGKEPVEWIVMGVFDDYVDLISLNILDVVPFHETRTSVVYSNSSINEFLNTEFLSGSFTDSELQAMLDISAPATANPEYQITDQGGTVTGKVYLPSAAKAAEFLPTDIARRCAGTAFAIANGLHVNENGYSAWWTRTMGEDNTHAVIVRSSGEVNYKGWDVTGADYFDIGFRPCIRVKAEALAGD